MAGKTVNISPENGSILDDHFSRRDIGAWREQGSNGRNA
jgi:hypothetical protein